MSATLAKRDYLALRSALAPRPSARTTGLVLVADHMFVLAAAWLAQDGGVLRQAGAILLCTFALLHCYLIHHECVHKSVFARDRYNVLLGQWLGFILVYPFFARRRSHMLHHAWAGHLERDPSNARARARLKALSPRQRKALDLLWRTWFPFLALNERIGLWRTSLSDHDGSRSAQRERASAVVALLGYVIAALACACVPALARFLSSYLAALVLLLVCEELINLPHHITAETVSTKQALWQQANVTHSCAYVPFWSSAVLLHFNLHTAHHLFPTLPWTALPAAERALSRHTSPTVHGHEFQISLRLRRARFSDVFAQYLRASEDSTSPAEAGM
jgi:omega-6 fatty acid desaturase (delta-12 desaturase)